MSKIGIFSGTFDPVHKGHIAFALKAAEAAGLDKVYLLPEAVPRRREGATHYAHRIAMLRLAVKPHRKLAVLDLPDKQFTVARTLPRLKKNFAGDELYLLLGSDVAPYLGSGAWPGTQRLLESVRLIVGLRAGADAAETIALLSELTAESNFLVVQTNDEHASSRDIRRALGQGKDHAAALRSIKNYIKQNWLYVEVPNGQP